MHHSQQIDVFPRLLHQLQCLVVKFGYFIRGVDKKPGNFSLLLNGDKKKIRSPGRYLTLEHIIVFVLCVIMF